MSCIRGSNSLTIFASGLYSLYHFAIADPPPYTLRDSEAYDIGEFGKFPEIYYRTSPFPSPHVLHRYWQETCDIDEEYYYFLTPYGWENEHPAPMIVDHRGHLIWYSDLRHNSYGLTVQTYNGEDYLTWWTGDDRLGHGIGSYYMVDSNYREFCKLGGMHNWPADHHDFHITPENTVLMTSYLNLTYNLSSFDTQKETGNIWDGCFQEYNPTTNVLLFEWCASKNFDVGSCSLPIGSHGSHGTHKYPWDFFHINSVDKDRLGNYLVSSRYCALSYVNGKTGRVEWHLGGPNNEFRDLSSDGRNALSFRYQHHARWTNDYSAITLFDNRVMESEHNVRRPRTASRGLKMEVNVAQRTVRSVLELVHPENWQGESQGSFQSLESGNYLLGYGHAPIVTEFNPDGEVVCDMQFAPMLLGNDNTLRSGSGQSYRAFKLRWVGIPYYDPRIFFDRLANQLFVSWNGATEVRRWRIEATVDRENWLFLQEVEKAGFESNLTVDSMLWDTFRLTAINQNNKSIRRWVITGSGTIQAEVSVQSYLRTKNTTHFVAWRLIAAGNPNVIWTETKPFRAGRVVVVRRSPLTSYYRNILAQMYQKYFGAAV